MIHYYQTPDGREYFEDDRGFLALPDDYQTSVLATIDGWLTDPVPDPRLLVSWNSGAVCECVLLDLGWRSFQATDGSYRSFRYAGCHAPHGELQVLGPEIDEEGNVVGPVPALLTPLSLSMSTDFGTAVGEGAD